MKPKLKDFLVEIRQHRDALNDLIDRFDICESSACHGKAYSTCDGCKKRMCYNHTNFRHEVQFCDKCLPTTSTRKELK